MKLRKKIFFTYISLLILLFILLAVQTQKVPLFSDGSKHAGIIREVTKSGYMPSEDFQGVQRNDLNSPVSIRTPFVYYPLFYLLGSEVFLFTGELDISLFLINLIPILASAALVLIIFKKIFNLKIGTIMFTLFLLSNLWLWVIVHRLMEPAITLLFLASLYLVLFYENLKIKDMVLIALLFSSLLLFKQSSLFILGPLFIVLLYKFKLKKSLIISLIFLLFILPGLVYFITNTGSIGITPPGIPLIDSHILNPWWEANPAPWENTLDNLSSSQSLREITQGQFNKIQISPKNLFNNHDYLGIIQEFFIYPIIDQGHQGYSPITQKNTFGIFWFLLIFSLLFSFKLNYKNTKSNLKIFLIFTGVLLIFAIFGWMKISVFRYFIFVDFLILGIFAFPILEFKKLNKKITAIIILMVFISIFINLGSEVERDKNYIYTVGHRALPSQNGGIFESIEISKLINQETENNSVIFTNIAEIGFYSERKIIWDDRLFFIKDESDLKEILKNYDFDYLVIPYYSGTLDYDNWEYYQGIPSDSEFNKILEDSSIFTKIKIYNSSTVYKFNKNETTN